MRRHVRKSPKLSKRGMELSINFIVMLILSITIFAFGLYMVRQFFGFAQSAQESVDLQTTAEIERRLLDAGEKVVIPINKDKVKIGTSKSFGLGVLNTYREKKTFGINMAYVNAFAPDGSRIEAEDVEKGYLDENWIYSNIPDLELNPNEHAVVPLTVRVDGKMTESGLGTRKGYVYVFNVCVSKDPAQRPDCADIGPAQLSLLHGEQVLKIYVQAE